MTWLSWAIAPALVAVALAVIVGGIRHDSRTTIALNTLGYPLLLVGLGAAAEVSMQAFLAAAAASLGSLLFTIAARNRRTTRPVGAGTLTEG